MKTAEPLAVSTNDMFNSEGCAGFLSSYNVNGTKSEDALFRGSVKFLNALIENKGIQGIIDIGYELMGNPIQVIDASYKVLASTKNNQINDSRWLEIIEFKYFSYDIVSILKDTFAKARNCKNPIVVHLKPKIDILHSAIRVDDKIVGYLLIPSILKPFDDNTLEIASLLTGVLSLAFKGNKFLNNSKETMYEFFIADLLDGNITDQGVIDERLKCLKWNLQDLYLLVVRRKENGIDNNNFLSRISEPIKNLLIGSKSIIYNSYIVTIINRKQKDFPSESELTQLTTLLTGNEMYGGVSRCFHSLVDIGECYQQCIKAMELGLNFNGQKVLFVYEDYALEHLLSSSQENLSSFCHKSLSVLEVYDRKYSDQLMLCLYEYLLNNKSINKTSEALHIHRNSLGPRIKKVSKIAQLDLDNRELCFHLLLSFKIMRFLKAKEGQIFQ